MAFLLILTPKQLSEAIRHVAADFMGRGRPQAGKVRLDSQRPATVH
jgi:hypothetical protein